MLEFLLSVENRLITSRMKKIRYSPKRRKITNEIKH